MSNAPDGSGRRPHQTGPVDGEQHRQVLQRHVVDQLVIGPLQEARIDGDHGFLVGDGDRRRR